MKIKYHMLLPLVLLLPACGSGDTSTDVLVQDNRSCVTLVQVSPDVTPATEGIEGAAADNGVSTTVIGGDVRACGTSTDIDAFVEQLEQEGFLRRYDYYPS